MILLLKKVEPEDGSDDTSYSSGEEEGDDSDPQSSDDEAENRRTLQNLKSPIPDPKFDPKSASRGNELDSDADSKRIPSNYMMQPIPKGSVSSMKRNRNETDGDLVRRCQRSKIEEKKSVSTPPGGGGLGCNAVDLNEPMAAKRKAEAKATTANSRAPASMPENEIVASIVQSLDLRTLLNTIKYLSVCQNPQEREILEGLMDQLHCQLGYK
ncbi:uncharacterized protein LOC125214033 [Salvia hispanica]|uniref:uncharacterized protein LOC125214033 n=1 Tax=Salvia hispanica TaxID=49212 RepID=UPI002009B0C5|nr:uncharacterized protein LOC125214033 [Salvia hispanica]XP_047970832.1 uncharacterized protein LOC125214033 [Salvia hispanica]XP_047970833.1 uncharacterized protein LOC125214033 [Salvia hispanica]XP_047970834.1 uncharacterized protein LOC125214033 [Salvia hispanica]XP_047970835.1 uncharacterized protein LOC125214033 [Salvia hispanica]